VWAGVDNVWEQEKPEARKMLVNRADSHTSGARFVGQPADQNDGRKKTPPPTRPTFTHNLFFSNGKKQNLPKRQVTKSDNQPKCLLQKWTLPTKTTNDQNANFEETDFGKKTTKPTKPR